MQPPDQTSTAFISSLATRVHAIATSIAGDSGTFVEAGANDGRRQSNTLMLEQAGWTGLLIEPSRIAFEACVRNRPNSTVVRCALVGPDGPRQIRGTFASDSLMASADGDLRHLDAAPSRFRGEARLRRLLGVRPRGTVVVPAQSLADVCRDAGVSSIDLLSLDVEGGEVAALSGLGDVIRPRVIVVETRRRDALAQSELLLGRGYVLVANLSGFTPTTNPGWSGDHQDLVWCPREDGVAIDAVHSVVR